MNLKELIISNSQITECCPAKQKSSTCRHLQGTAGTLLWTCRTNPPLISPDGQAGVFAAWSPISPCSPLVTQTGFFWAEAPMAGDLELLSLLKDPTRWLTVVGAGWRGSNPLLWRSGWLHPCSSCCARVLADWPRSKTSSPWKPLAADSVGLRESSGVSLAPRSAHLSPPRLLFCFSCWPVINAKTMTLSQNNVHSSFQEVENHHHQKKDIEPLLWRKTCNLFNLTKSQVSHFGQTHSSNFFPTHRNFWIKPWVLWVPQIIVWIPTFQKFKKTNNILVEYWKNVDKIVHKFLL